MNLNKMQGKVFTGCSKRSRYKAPETGHRPEGVGLSGPFREEILRNKAYIEVRRNKPAPLKNGEGCGAIPPLAG
jgi:hypothetical protein